MDPCFVVSTYVNEVFGVENVRDLIAEQILLGSPKTLDVNMLYDHLSWITRELHE